MTQPATGSGPLTDALAAALPGHRVVRDPPWLGDLFEPQSAGYLGNADDLIVEHSLGNLAGDLAYLAKFDRRIILVRHPFAVILAALLDLPSHGPGFLGNANAARFYNAVRALEEFDDSFGCADLWRLAGEIDPPAVAGIIAGLARMQAVDRLTWGDLFLVKHEDFAGGEDLGLSRWLGCEVVPAAVAGSSCERGSRRTAGAAWADWFCPADQAHFAAIGAVAEYAARFGYALDTPLNQPQHRDPGAGSGHVRHLVNRQRRSFSVDDFTPDDAIGLPGEARFLAAVEANAAGRHDEALDKATAAVLAAPRNPGYLFALGKCLLASRHLLSAEKALSRSLALYENNPEAWRLLAECMRLEGKPEAAVAAARRAIALAPDIGEHYRLAGTLLSALGRWEEAEQVFRSAVAVPAAPPQFSKTLALNLWEQKKWTEALEVLGRAETLLAHRSDFHLLKADLLHNLRRPEEAWQSILAAEDLAPADAHVARLKQRLGAPEPQGAPPANGSP